MDYFGILTLAAKTLWKHKTIYAFLLIFTAIPTILPLIAVGFFIFSIDMEQPDRWFSVFEQPFNSGNLSIILALSVGYLLSLLLSFFCAIVSHIGVLKGAALSEHGIEPVDFSALWQAGMKYFWRVAAVLLAVGAVAILGLGILIVPAMILGPFFMVVLCIIIPLFNVGRVAVEILVSAIVNDDLGIFDGLNRLWQLTQNQPGPLALITALLLAIDFVAYIVLLMPVNIVQQVGMQFLFINPLQQQRVSSTNPGELFRWVFMLQLLAYPILIALQAFVQTYHLSTVSLFYVRIIRNPVLPEFPANTVAAD